MVKNDFEIRSSIFDKYVNEFSDEFAYAEYSRLKYKNRSTQLQRFLKSLAVLFLYMAFIFTPVVKVMDGIEDSGVNYFATFLILEFVLIGLGISLIFIKFPSYISSYEPTDVEIFRAMRFDLKSGYHFKHTISIAGCVVTILTGLLFSGGLLLLNGALTGAFIPYIGGMLNSFLVLMIFLIAAAPVLMVMNAAGIDYTPSRGMSKYQASRLGMILGRALFWSMFKRNR